MGVKHLSTRFSIVRRSKGQSAVDKASYISRSVLYCEYDGQNYRPKYQEDLVHSEISLPVNAPEEFADRAALWNSVELAEKGKRAQLARMLKASLPNDWSYELAEETVRDYVQRNFVSQGMCADWAIHDSENREGQRNLHIHVLLTMRPLTQDGKWGAKQRKVYILDKDGNKIRNWNGKGYRSTTEFTTDWNDRKKAKIWRKDLADTINAVNEKAGIGGRWEYRSFRELGIEREPSIHLGAGAGRLEKKGIQTGRGNINREIMEQNALLEQALADYEAAEKKVEEIRASRSCAVPESGNEILELIRNIVGIKKRLALPIIGGRYIRRISNREVLQRPENAATFISSAKISSFAELEKFADEKEKEWEMLDGAWKSVMRQLERRNDQLRVYARYEPYARIYRESLGLKGLAKLKYDREHKKDLEKFPLVKSQMASLLDNGEKIATEKWRMEIQSIEKEMDSLRSRRGKVAAALAYSEIISYNRKDYEREEANRSRRQQKKLGSVQKKRTYDIEL